MTTEEKAKAYDEAIKRARKQRDEYQKEFDKTDKDSKLASILRAAISAIELAFPELSESEDERIMKALIEVFKKKLERGFEWVEYGIPNRSVLDWLEKQKENSEYVFRPLAGTDITIAAEQAIRKAKEGDRLVLAFNGFYTPVFKHDSVKRIMDEYDSFIEKPKEQSEEPKIVFGDWGDKEKREAIITCLKYMRFIKKITNQEYDDLIKWLDNNTVSNVSEKEECLREVEQKEQKPAEKHDLVTQLKEHFANTPKEQLEAEWKELEHWNNIGPTVEEYFHRIKPAEWSEEDEKMLNLTKMQLRILQSHLSHAHSESMSDMEYSSQLLQIEKCVSWLDIHFKSIRPQPMNIIKIDELEDFIDTELHKDEFIRRWPQYAFNVPEHKEGDEYSIGVAVGVGRVINKLRNFIVNKKA